MAEYCLQCYQTTPGIEEPEGIPVFLTKKKNERIECEGCGKTIVNIHGLCTGACGKDEHMDPFMNYIFDTKSPSFQFVQIRKKNLRTLIFKIGADSIQWIPRIFFTISIFYLFSISLILRGLQLKNKNKDVDIIIELCSMKAGSIYKKGLDLWYKGEIKLEQLLF